MSPYHTLLYLTSYHGLFELTVGELRQAQNGPNDLDLLKARGLICFVCVGILRSF